MSSECERVFSAAKKIVTDERNQLSAETIEAVECARYWVKAGLISTRNTKLSFNWDENDRLYRDFYSVSIKHSEYLLFSTQISRHGLPNRVIR